MALTLKRPYADGTTEKLFTPTEFVERLASITPPPHCNQTLYHGVLASQSKVGLTSSRSGRGDDRRGERDVGERAGRDGAAG